MSVCVEIAGVPSGGAESDIVVTLNAFDNTAGKLWIVLLRPCLNDRIMISLNTSLVEGDDYVSPDPLTVVFAADVGIVSGSTACATITIVDDLVVETDESFSVTITSSDPPLRYSTSVTVVTITDNDGEHRGQLVVWQFFVYKLLCVPY